MFKKYQPDEEFTAAYVRTRELENRILTTEQIRQLPYLTDHPLGEEWKLRQKSTERLLRYIQRKKIKKVLDLGCGNGWLSYRVAPCVEQLTAVDINPVELEQAAELLHDYQNTTIWCCNILQTRIDERFDLIYVNGTIQYFPDLDQLIKRLLACLTPLGELHILDSPFYSSSQLAAAKNRTAAYYDALGSPAMKARYFHHHWAELADFNYRVLYRPQSLFRKLCQRLGRKDSPFPWIKIVPA